MTELQPSEKREVVLADHRVLKERLERLQSLATTAADADGDKRREALVLARDALKELRVFFLAHLDREEQLLLPELKSVDGFGPERVRALLAEHKMQRADLDGLVAAFEGPLPDVAALSGFVSRLLEDMKQEEEQHLSAKVLHDDLVSSDHFGG